MCRKNIYLTKEILAGQYTLPGFFVKARKLIIDFSDIFFI